MTDMHPIFSGNTRQARDQAVAALLNDSLNIVCDGSFLETENAATAGFILEDESRSFKIKCSIITPGEEDDMSAYRAELSGLLAAVCFVNSLCQEYDLSDIQYTLGCDGKGAVQSIQYHLDLEKVKSTKKHFDMINSITKNIHLHQSKVSLHHIKGHQDDEKEYCDLDRAAQLNVQADRLAKRRLKQLLNDRSRGQHIDCSNVQLPLEGCSIFRTDRQGHRIKITSELEKQLNLHLASNNIKDYWVDKGKFERCLEKRIDWEVMHKASKALSNGRRTQVSKWLTGFCGVGKMLVKYKHQSHSRCPRCNTENEDVTHMIQCQADSAKAAWDAELKKLEAWMVENDGDPDMIQAIIGNLNAWRGEHPFPYTYYDNRSLRKALTQQDRIGWQSFLEGFKSLQWRLVQQQHLANIGSQKSAILWMSRLQQKLWEVMKAMWQDRNNTLHNEGNTVHQEELRAIDAEILAKWQIGIDILPRHRYEHLFCGQRQQRLTDTIHQKKMWLSSVWSARDRYGETDERQRDTIASDFYKRWKQKLVFQHQNKIINEEISVEWLVGLNTLNQQLYEHLFHNTLQHLISRPLHLKKRWLCRVWEARDREGDPHDRQRNQVLVTIYEEWRAQQEER